MSRAVVHDDLLPDGFEAFYRASVDRVYSYARTRLGPDEAEDVAAEVYQAALVALRGANAQAVTEAWLMAVTRNKVIDRWRAAERRMRKHHLLGGPDRTPAPDWSPGDGTERLRVALDGLSTRHRALLVLHYVDGHPMAEVAAQLGTTIEAARSGIARARRALRSAYGKVVLDA